MTRERLSTTVLLLNLVLMAGAKSFSGADDGAAPDFDREVAGIFASRCLDCHNGTERKGELDLSRREAAMEGGEDGTVIVTGKPDDSALWKLVSANKMPKKRPPLPDKEKAILRRWIASGAKWGTNPINPFRFTTTQHAGFDWWSLQPLGRVEAPVVKRAEWTRNPIDAFIAAALEKARLSPSPVADRRTLVRRVTFDLIGLPPTPPEVEAFVNDPSPDAYEKLVDRLLASTQYGVRWARHWLDIIRFGESNGFERDEFRSNSWRYRDWVVDAFNADMPYDHFTRMQLAGDLIKPGSAEGIIATGYLVAGAYDQVGQTQQSKAMRAVVRADEMEDLVGTVSQTFLGLTANCARCHDHKFDPIAQKEFYQLASTLSGVRHGERDLPAGAASPDLKAFNVATDARLASLQSELARIEEPVRNTLLAKLKSYDRALTADEVSSSSGKETTVSDADLVAALPESQRARRVELRHELEAIRQLQSRAASGKVYACVPGAAVIMHVQLRGDPAAEGAEVQPAGIASITGAPADFGLAGHAADGERRLKLAGWITDPRNPLLPRVIVNRLWQYHFGVGIVDTPNDLGFNGGRPTHPLLLDYLAARLQAENWSLKKLHRLIVTSATYRQASLIRSECMSRDAGNRLLWRMNPRRVEAEALRDAMLSVAGELNGVLGGPGFEDFSTFTSNSTFYEFRDYVGATFNRRSLYRTWVRSGRSPLLDAFDCPDPSTKTPRRAVTTTPLQALALMNDSFTLRMSDALAARARREAGENPREQVEAVYQRALGRSATSEELSDSAAFIGRHSLADLCRVIFNTSEFVTVD